MDLSAATGVARRDGEPVSDVLPVDLVDRATGEVRQDLLAQIAPVHIGGPWLPDPFVSLEHGLGDGLQQRLVGPERYGPAPADRGHHLGGAGPRLADAHGRGIANNLPDALSSMLAMDEKPFTVGGQHPDAEALRACRHGCRRRSCAVSAP